MVKEFNYIDATKQYIDYSEYPLIIWGISENALYEYIYLKTHGAKVEAFADSYHQTEGDSFAGLPVLTMRQMQDLDHKFYLYITSNKFEHKKQILERVSSINNALVIAKGVVYAAGEYDTALMSEKINQDMEIIDYIRGALADTESVRVFDLLLDYRKTNDVSLLDDAFERTHPQYFPPVGEGIIDSLNEEIFVDAGAYDGETTLQFIRWTNGNYKKIYTLEPDELMYEITKERLKLKNAERVELCKYGAYSDEQVISFVNDSETGSSFISSTEDSATSTIYTLPIDNLVMENGGATYIKMDIEGAEMEALIGSKKTIEKYHPKLAISIYHKEDDLWKIPHYIHNHYPFYRLYIRHYTDITTETILYAV